MPLLCMLPKELSNKLKMLSIYKLEDLETQLSVSTSQSFAAVNGYRREMGPAWKGYSSRLKTYRTAPEES
jgi:hypothetical protein